MTDKPVRMRIAPSPTGEPHIGTVYTALFNVLLAKKLGGEMILRIEDTDQSRSTPESERKVLEALAWSGLDWTEGPDKGGAYGPYRQSERKDLYRPYIDQLVDKGHAFKCFCTKDRLDEMRAGQRLRNEQQKYDGLCARLTSEEVAEREAAGESYVVRMKIPTEGDCSFEDGIYGKISMPWNTIDMQVLLKSDGMPTYHLANVVDDHLMGITHVARGEEWLPSVPKHIALYEYFGWDKPEFLHLPLMRNADKSKLSKRRNPTSVSYFSGQGYMPEAVLNFLGLFFVAIAEGEEMMDLDQLAEAFDPASAAKGGAVFDIQKLNWLNARWIREKMTPEQFREAVIHWITTSTGAKEALDLAQTRIVKMSDLPSLMGFAFNTDLNLQKADFEGLKNGADDSLEVLKAVRPLVDALPEWNRDAIEQAIRDLADELERKLRVVVPPLFMAINGSTKTLPLFDSMALLGRAIVRQRIVEAITLLSKS
jgi:glutamyl-tRNA synthetase